MYGILFHETGKSDYLKMSVVLRHKVSRYISNGKINDIVLLLKITALSFKIVLHLGEYCYFIADIGSSLFSDFMISPYEV